MAALPPAPPSPPTPPTPPPDADLEHDALMAFVRRSHARHDDPAAHLLDPHVDAHVSYSDHDSVSDDDHTPPHSSSGTPPVHPDLPADAACVVCFERPPNVTLDPCGHANLCDVCVSRLVKRRCPTCRARARKAAIRLPGESVVTKPVRDVINDRKLRESRVLEDTLQVVFLGPEKVGKKTMVRKLIARFPCTAALSSVAELDEEEDASEAPSPEASLPDDVDVFSDGTDFSANATIAGVNVRLTVLRRTTLTSRRMVLDDVRVLKPDVLVLCCSAHVGATFETILSWDKVLRNNFQKPRVWALLELDEHAALQAGGATLDTEHDVAAAINLINPTDLRPKGHYLCSPGEQFSIGFRSLAKDIVSLGRIARDEELAASIALEEARSMADHEAAGTIGDQAAANLVIANNGIGMATGSSSMPGHGARGAHAGRGSGVGRSFLWRGLRERGGGANGNGQGISFSGFVNWLAGSHES